MKNIDSHDFSIISINELVKNSHLTREKINYIVKADKIFLKNIRQEPEIAVQAYYYGLVIGAYISMMDAENVNFAAKKIIGKKQSQARKLKDGQVNIQPWQPIAKDLAKKAREKYPMLKQAAVAEYIQKN